VTTRFLGMFGQRFQTPNSPLQGSRICGYRR
jgi:hypothetical protein